MSFSGFLFVLNLKGLFDRFFFCCCNPWCPKLDPLSSWPVDTFRYGFFARILFFNRISSNSSFSRYFSGTKLIKRRSSPLSFSLPLLGFFFLLILILFLFVGALFVFSLSFCLYQRIRATVLFTQYD